MDTKACQEVQDWLQQLDQPDQTHIPPGALVAHIAGCENCRRLLLMLTARMLPALPDVDVGSHETCQDDLAGYIDALRDHGLAEAAQRYPHVWWHLATCADCAETYDMTVALLEAEDHGLIASLPLPQPRTAAPAPRRRPLGVFRVARSFINQVLDPLGQLGAALGDDDEQPTILGERRVEQHRMVLSLQQGTDAIWEVHITVVPPIRGYATVRLGSASFRIALSATSEAHVPISPPDLLTDPAGPDLLVEIDQDEGALPFS